MATFVTALFFFLTVLLALSVPAVIVARRAGRNRTVRRFMIWAVALGVFCALISMGSERLVDQCTAAGNLECLDFGSNGFQLLFVAGYGATSLINAYNHRD